MDRYASAAFFYDAVTDGKPQSGSLSHLLGSKERVENLFNNVRRDTDTGIEDFDSDRFIRDPGRNDDSLLFRKTGCRLPFRFDGIPGIDEKIDEHLFQAAPDRR